LFPWSLYFPPFRAKEREEDETQGIRWFILLGSLFQAFSKLGAVRKTACEKIKKGGGRKEKNICGKT